jgi:hypothetical protein
MAQPHDSNSSIAALRASVGENALSLIAIDSEDGQGRWPGIFSGARLETDEPVGHLPRSGQRKSDHSPCQFFEASNASPANRLFR